MRSFAVSYSLGNRVLSKLKVLKSAVVTVSANNLILITNYKGYPEVAAAGAGVGGSSAVGFDYCGVPSTAGMTLCSSLTFESINVLKGKTHEK